MLRIEELDNPINIANIRKWNGEQLRKVRGGIIYIEDPLPS